MNIKEDLTCKYCNEIYTEPVTLNCCGDNICRRHMKILFSIGNKKRFLCPFCNEQNLNQNFRVNKTIQYLLDIEAHKFTIDPKYEQVLNNFRAVVRNLETILNEPENYIYEKINEVKRQVDLDREKAKTEIDKLADGFIQQLETHEKQFKAEYKANIDMKHLISLSEASKKQLKEYESCLNLLSNKTEQRDQQTKQSEISIKNLKSKIEQLKQQLFINMTIKYNPTQNSFNKLFNLLFVN